MILLIFKYRKYKRILLILVFYNLLVPLVCESSSSHLDPFRSHRENFVKFFLKKENFVKFLQHDKSFLDDGGDNNERKQHIQELRGVHDHLVTKSTHGHGDWGVMHGKPHHLLPLV